MVILLLYLFLWAGAISAFSGYTGINDSLKIAVKNNHLGVVGSCIESGANPNIILDKKSGEAAWSHAAKTGNFDVARVLLAAGASPDSGTELFGVTPLVHAILQENIKMVELLLHYNVDAWRVVWLRDPKTGHAKVHTVLYFATSRWYSSPEAAHIAEMLFQKAQDQLRSKPVLERLFCYSLIIGHDGNISDFKERQEKQKEFAYWFEDREVIDFLEGHAYV